MKTIFNIILVLTLSVGFLTGCDRSKSKSSGVNSGGYNPYGSGPFPGNFEFSSRANVVDQQVYRAFLKGDFCRSTKRDCKRIDGDPRIAVSLTQLDIPLDQQVFAQFTLSVQPSRYSHYYSGGPAVGRFILGLRRVNNNTQFEGNAIDRNTGNGFGARVQFLGTGNPAAGTFDLDVYYDGKLMLEARMIRRR